MEKEIYDYQHKEFVTQPEKVKRFLEEIRKVCEEYQLSIWKQDGYNIEFIIEKYNENHVKSLEQASINLEPQNISLSLEDRMSEFFLEQGINVRHIINEQEEDIREFNQFSRVLLRKKVINEVTSHKF